MPLKLRPTGLGAGIDKDRPDYTIYSGGWAMGRIHEQRGGPDSMRWFWSLYGIFGKPADMPTATRQRSTGPRRSSNRYGGAGWRGRSCVRTRSSSAATATLGGPTPGRL